MTTNYLRRIAMFVCTGSAVALLTAASSLATMSSTPLSGYPQTNSGGYVNDVAIYGDTVYVGGSFSTFGGESRQNLAAFSLSGGEVTSWDPSADDEVTAIDSDGTYVYVGGDFTTVGANDYGRGHFAQLSASTGNATSYNVGTDTPGSGNAIDALTYSSSDSATFVGGNFTLLGTYTGAGTELTTSSATADATLPAVSGGTIYASVADGSGGWYIGGSFTSVAGSTRNRLAHIVSDGTLDSAWDPNANGTVYALEIEGSGASARVYAGGSFTTVGGSSRNYLAQIGADGTLSSWNPGANGTVRALTNSGTSGDSLYVGGEFTTLGSNSLSRNNLGKISSYSNDAADTSFNPSPDDFVYALLYTNNSNAQILVGGEFSTIGASSRRRAASVDTSGNVQSYFNPTIGTASSTTDAVYAFAYYFGGAYANDRFYVGGSFSEVGSGTTRNNIASFDQWGSVNSSFNPNANGTVRSIVTYDISYVYFGGAFTTVGGSTRRYLASMDTSSNLQSWDPAPDASIYTVALTGTSIYAGGGGTLFNTTARDYAAKINNSGSLDSSWDPDASAAVKTLALSGSSSIYAGGSFTSIGGSSRNYIAELSTSSTGSATSFNPSASTTVSKLLVSGTDVYAAGSFTTIGTNSASRYGLVKLGSTGSAASWDPDPSTAANSALASNGSDIFVGGTFTSIGGLVRSYLAQIDSSGDAYSWNPAPGSSGSVKDLAFSDPYLVVAGSFSTMGSGDDAVVRKGLAIFEDISAPVNSVAPSVSGTAALKQNLTCSSGSWTSSDTPTYSYQWYRSDQVIGQAQSSTYTVTADDEGAALSCKVTATNIGGSTTATSSSVTVSDSSSSDGDDNGSSTKQRVTAHFYWSKLRELLKDGKLHMKLRARTKGTAHIEAFNSIAGEKAIAVRNVNFTVAGAKVVALHMKWSVRRKLLKRMRAKRLQRLVIKVEVTSKNESGEAGSPYQESHYFHL